MRGTKLTAWQMPPVWNSLQDIGLPMPENSKAIKKQRLLLKATQETLAEIVRDVREGLLETVGVESSLSTENGRCSVVLELPDGVDTETIAQAIDLENIEAWRDESGKVHVAVSPWYSTKDVDQAVLSAVKVIHVMIGIHAADMEAAKPKTLGQKLLASFAEVMQIQKEADKK